MLNREKALSGLLQKWVEPKGGHNCKCQSALIKVVWSPLFSVLERRLNVHKLQDSSVDFYDRLLRMKDWSSTRSRVTGSTAGSGGHTEDLWGSSGAYQGGVGRECGSH